VETSVDAEEQEIMNTTRRVIVSAALALIVLELLVPPVFVMRTVATGNAVVPTVTGPRPEGHVWRWSQLDATSIEWPRFTGELLVIGLVAGCLVLLLAPSPKPRSSDQPVRVKKTLALNRAQGLVIVGGVLVASLFGLSFLNSGSDNYWLLIFGWAVVAALTCAGALLAGGVKAPIEQPHPAVPDDPLPSDGIRWKLPSR
jgi:hypothetical protein